MMENMLNRVTESRAIEFFSVLPIRGCKFRLEIEYNTNGLWSYFLPQLTSNLVWTQTRWSTVDKSSDRIRSVIVSFSRKTEPSISLLVTKVRTLVRKTLVLSSRIFVILSCDTSHAFVIHDLNDWYFEKTPK